MALDTRPGLNSRRLIRLLSTVIDRCQLELTDRTVLTEAATGAYVVTPILAAMAGANVYALTLETNYASADEIYSTGIELARAAAIADRIQFIRSKDQRYVGTADIVTNSGQVRPIDASMVASMKQSAVIPLMYESWEYRRCDVDLEACRARGIVVAGTNERHPDVDIYSYLGAMAIRQLQDAGIAVRGSRILLLCDNPFSSFIAKDLRDAGAAVIEVSGLSAEVLGPYCDAVLLATRPFEGHNFTEADAKLLSHEAPGAVLVQFWGDADYPALTAAGVPVWPEEQSRAGHMGVLPSTLGPEPVVLLQAGGLKVGQVLARGISNATPDDLARVQLL
jgi:hypothetical protein